ncbi:methionine biosynthesis protein MetW [Candidatus Reidiella endopervernicosa]|uniref:methionine biosynthesis protein MetW n=1 Tax=Candidatus Reidiella endopervernicosa TaxID=2738883 RepID=UPI0023514EE1|nr:methionine biosynthesis protein MetW [Candidatus Reidiella endopervernicosa]
METALLSDLRNATRSGYGLEIDEKNIATCIRAGVNVIHTDLDAGLADFEADTFDYVIMTQTLQAMHFPERLLDEMLRVGRQGIVTFPNFGHWRTYHPTGRSYAGHPHPAQRVVRHTQHTSLHQCRFRTSL